VAWSGNDGRSRLTINKRADERTRTADLISLQVRDQWLLSLAEPQRKRAFGSLCCPLLHGIACGLGSNVGQLVVSRSTKVAISDFVLALSLPPLDGRREVELVREYTQSHAILNHLSVPSLAMARNAKNLAREDNVMDVLVLGRAWSRVPITSNPSTKGLPSSFPSATDRAEEWGSRGHLQVFRMRPSASGAQRFA
jgi:hypothetical protein